MGKEKYEKPMLLALQLSDDVIVASPGGCPTENCVCDSYTPPSG